MLDKRFFKSQKICTAVTLGIHDLIKACFSGIRSYVIVLFKEMVTAFCQIKNGIKIQFQDQKEPCPF